MKKIRLLIIVFSLIFLSINVTESSAVNQVFSTPLPWHFEDLYWDPHVNDGYYVSLAHHPVDGRAYISYYDTKNNVRAT